VPQIIQAAKARPLPLMMKRRMLKKKPQRIKCPLKGINTIT